MPKPKNKIRQMADKKEDFIKGLKIIFKYLRVYKKDLIILTILAIFSAIANGVVPYLAGRLFDAILDPSKVFIGTMLEMPLFLFFIIVWGLVKLAADLVDWQSGVRSEKLSNITHADYIAKGFGKLLELPLSFHKQKKMGEVGERLNRASSFLSQMAGVLIEIAPQFLSIVIALLITFLIKPILALMLIMGIVVYVLILVRIVPPLVTLQRKGHRAYRDAYGDAYDAMSNVQVIKQATSERYEQKNLYRKFHVRAVKLWNQIVSIWQGVNFYQRLIILFVQFAIFGISIFFIQQGEMTIGQLVMFNGYAAMMFYPFVRLGQNWQTIQNGFVAIEQAEQVLALPSENYAPKDAVILEDIKGEVVFDNANFAYQGGKRKVLDEVSFKVKPGEVVALVGESGVGKSTLVDLISGYYFSQTGQVLIDGHNVKKFDLKFLRSRIAVVPQEVFLFNDTIKTNVKYGSFSASDEEIQEAAKKAHALEFIESFPKKFNQIVGERGIKLSVGQKQRVAIARAILRDPRILILDEPTSALDAKSEKFINESLAELMKDRTTFIIAHRFSTVRRADKIIVLDKGKVVEQGNHEDLIEVPNGIYKNLYELQIGLK